MLIEGALADWAMHGIYGWIRPTLYTQSQADRAAQHLLAEPLGLPLNMLR